MYGLRKSIETKSILVIYGSQRIGGLQAGIGLKMGWGAGFLFWVMKVF